MEADKYDPKLSQAGFMDLVVALKAQLETPDSGKILTGMPQAQREAVCELRATVKNYVDVIEGRSSPFALHDGPTLVPEGMVLMPIRPTQAMVTAVDEVFNFCRKNGLGLPLTGSIYEAMLESAKGEAK